MLKRILKKLLHFNHEVWIKCIGCGDHYDARAERDYDDYCPKCKTKNN